LDSIGGFDEFNCARALAPFRGFDATGNAITNESVAYQIGFIQQDTQGKISWTNRPEIELVEDEIGIQVPGDLDVAANSSPNLVGVNAAGEWTKLEARTGQTASTVKWNPGKGFTLVTDSTEPSSCTSLSQSLTLTAGSTGPYTAFVASTASLTVGLSVLMLSKEYLVTAVGSGTVTLTAAVAPAATSVLPIGTYLCGVGFKPVSGITSSYVDTITGSLSGASASLTFPADVSSQKVPGLFWRDQTGKVSFLAAPVDGSGVITPNQILKTPGSPTSGTANLPTFVPAPGGYTWLAAPYQVAALSQVASSSPVNGTFPYDVSATPGFVSGSKAVILDVQLVCATNTQTYKTVVSINGLNACAAYLGSSFSAVTDTNQMIVPIVSSTSLSMLVTTIPYNSGTYSNWSLIVKVIGFIG